MNFRRPCGNMADGRNRRWRQGPFAPHGVLSSGRRPGARRASISQRLDTGATVCWPPDIPNLEGSTTPKWVTRLPNFRVIEPVNLDLYLYYARGARGSRPSDPGSVLRSVIAGGPPCG